ncbi:MAG: hypothetical protein CVU38_19560 [Chloroflexi bacterium HGW-Chloroflexi-1]|nr:MAG: hypothetical protein CVU38_19560 [Chloroflexi bacterium HGW-Chloroflexi-1]
MLVTQTINSKAARQNWRDLLDAAHKGTGDTVIERNGRPIAAVIPYADFLALQEELDELRAARRGQAAYAAWQRDPSLGRPWAEIKAEMIRDGLLDA